MQKNHRRGFTLMELSIVLLVLSLIAGSVMTIITQNVRVAKQRELQEKLTRIQDALLLYRKKNNRLPCPADVTQAMSAANFGVEGATPADCDAGTPAANFTNGVESIYGGGLPVKTLNLSLQDAFDPWGNHFFYAVDKLITASGSPFITYPITHTTIGNMAVLDVNYSAITQRALYVVLSHGENGHGAYGQNGVRISAESVNLYEQGNCHCDENAADDGLNIFFYQMQDRNSTTNLDTFDDKLVYATRPQMLNGSELTTE